MPSKKFWKYTRDKQTRPGEKMNRLPKNYKNEMLTLSQMLPI